MANSTTTGVSRTYLWPTPEELEAKGQLFATSDGFKRVKEAWGYDEFGAFVSMVDSTTTDPAKCPHHHRWGSYEPFGPDVCQDCGVEIETEMSRHRLEEKNDVPE